MDNSIDFLEPIWYSRNIDFYIIRNTMKKVIVISTLCSLAILTWCTSKNVSPQEETLTIQSGNSFSMTSTYVYDRDMKIPSIKDLANRDSLSKWYNETKNITYTITQENIDAIEEINKYSDNICKKWNISILWNGLDSAPIGSIQYKDLNRNKTINLSIPYTWNGLWLVFSSWQINDLNTQWWMIMEANSDMLARIIWNNNYDPNTIESSIPERANYIDLIWWSQSPQQRYPYNTVYISSDLLLHTYHKLFSNSLKEYEMVTARGLITTIIDDSLDVFSKLNASSSSDMKPYYEYLVAYRSIAKILLPNNQDMQNMLQAPRDIDMYKQREANIDNGDFKDEYLKEIILQRLQETIKQYPTQYNKSVSDSIISILSGTDNQSVDLLSQAFSPQTDPNFIVKQDYTQFVPRSHYTDNSYLKTYFMAMKWMMRHKMYNRDPKASQSALIMARNFPISAQQGLQQLQEFVHTMVGADDDINVEDLQQFLWEKWLRSDSDIVSKYDSWWEKDITNLRPQKIISTSYITPSVWSTTESQAKDITAGFVFFGEKFTPDAWIMDQLTAWSAEQESIKKPLVVSVYQVRDTIMWWSWSQYALTRLQNNMTDFEITSSHINNYQKLRNETQLKLSWNTDMNTIYNKWIQLAKVSTILPNNPPAYMKHNSFIDKIFNTVIGTYTELKHDTLLYVKQAYAELGMWWDGDCSISIDVPVLPVPKWYVEPQIDLIDHLSQLSQETSTFFWDTNKENFNIFNQYLSFIKGIALAQTENKQISDDDFEKLRLSFPLLQQIMTPSSTYTSNGEKGMRSAIIADIFTSGEYGPYYIANGRPLLMVVSIDDINGKRAVIWPVYSTYEFYGEPIPATAGRYTDKDRRSAYDTLTNKKDLMTLPLQKILSE